MCQIIFFSILYMYICGIYFVYARETYVIKYNRVRVQQQQQQSGLCVNNWTLKKNCMFSNDDINVWYTHITFNVISHRRLRTQPIPFSKKNRRPCHQTTRRGALRCAFYAPHSKWYDDDDMNIYVINISHRMSFIYVRRPPKNRSEYTAKS